MPNSINSSRFSTISHHHDSLAAKKAAFFAKETANREVAEKLQDGKIPQNKNAITIEYKAIYRREYYKQYAFFQSLLQEYPFNAPRVVYITKEANKKYDCFHPVVRFTKLNNLIISNQQKFVTVNKLNLSIDSDNFQEINELFLQSWPGPLDRSDEKLTRSVESYMDNLLQHDSQRKLHYVNKDDQRKLILKLLIQLLQRNGFIDGPGVTRLLLPASNTEIMKEEKKPIETLKKYLILGKRSEAVKFAKLKEMWDHAHCLAFLDKYQPQNNINYIQVVNTHHLLDDSLVQLNLEYISTIKDEVIQIVYRSLLNRILFSDPESAKQIKHTDVNNDSYKFAILCANDCEMEYDQTNELFKLIKEIKFARIYPSAPHNHQINLGLLIESTDSKNESISQRSSVSFKKIEPDCFKKLLSSNLDMLIINEVWEYCLNLCCGTYKVDDYNYIFELIPSKLILASRLLDFGMYDKFSYYLTSLKLAYDKAKRKFPYEPDQSFDWKEIERNIDYLFGIWETFRINLGFDNLPVPDSFNSQENHYNHRYQNIAPSHKEAYTSQYNPINSIVQQDIPQIEQQMPAYPQQTRQNFYQPPPPPPQQQQFLQQPFDAPPPKGFSDAASNENSRRDSLEQPIAYNQMASSSLVYNNLNPDSFQTPYSPINENEPTIEKRSTDYSPPPLRKSPEDDPHPPRTRVPSSSQSVETPSRASDEYQSNQATYASQGSQQPSSNQQQQQQHSSQQSTGLFTKLATWSIIPKSNAKQMHLPDDTEKMIEFDEKTGSWVNKGNSENDDLGDLHAPPPMMPPSKPSTYKFDTSTNYKHRRYPQP